MLDTLTIPDSPGLMLISSLAFISKVESAARTVYPLSSTIELPPSQRIPMLSGKLKSPVIVSPETFTLAFKAVCKSAWSESVPVILPHGNVDPPIKTLHEDAFHE